MDDDELARWADLEGRRFRAWLGGRLAEAAVLGAQARALQLAADARGRARGEAS